MLAQRYKDFQIGIVRLDILRLLVLLLTTAAFSCSSVETNRSEQTANTNAILVVNATPTPLGAGDFDKLRRFAESYEPRSGREVIPSPPILEPQLSALIEKAAQTGSRTHEPYVVLIFLKLSRFNVEHFKQSYELGRENPLTKEFYRLIGETNYERAELMSSSLADDYVKKHPELFEYDPIKTEFHRITKAEEKIKLETQKR